MADIAVVDALISTRLQLQRLKHRRVKDF